MSVTAVNTPIHQAAMIGLPTARPVAAKPPQPQSEAKAHSLAKTDSVVLSGLSALANLELENAVIGAWGSYQDSQSALERSKLGVHESGALTGIGAAAGRSALRRLITSGARNGWELYQGRITTAEAGGRVVGDVATSVVSGSMGAVASKAVVWGFSKTQAAPLTILAVGTVSGWGANLGSNYLLRRAGFSGAIADQSTRLLQKLN